MFEEFQIALPDFAGRNVQCAVGADPPDFICIDFAGTQIGVELSEWVHQDQIARERPRYQLEREYLRVLDSRGAQPPTNIGSIWIFPKQRIALSEAATFRAQLYAFITQLDASWLARKDHGDPQGVGITDFSEYLLLTKYLSSIMCWSRAHRPTTLGNEWIGFMPHGGPYAIKSAVEALEDSLKRKTAKYATLKTTANLSELYLLLYYDQGFHYNTPFDAPGFGFSEIVSHIAQMAASDHGAFDRIFLFIPAKQQVAIVY